MHKTVFWALLFLPFAGFGHDLRLSVTNIDFDTDNQIFSLVMKINADDFARISHTPNDSLPLEQKDRQKFFRNKIAPWLNADFVIWQEGKRAKLQFIRFESDTDWVWLFLEFSLEPSGIWTIENRLLFGQYPEQVNLLVIQYADDQQGFSFTPAEPEKTIRWTK